MTTSIGSAALPPAASAAAAACTRDGVCWLPDRIDPGDLAALLGRARVGLLLVDEQGSTLLVNTHLVKLFRADVPLEAMAGQPVAQWSASAPFDQLSSVWAGPPPASRTVRLSTGTMVKAQWATLPDRDGVRVLTVHDVSAELGSQQQLRAHNRALAELVATKTEQVSGLLHRLRTPLTSLSTAVQLLPDETDGDPLSDMLRRSTHRLREVVNDIAVLSALENGTAPIAHDRVDLPALITDTVADWRQRLTGGTRLGTEVTDGPPVHGDAALLRSLLDRMIAVAVAAAPSDTDVHLSADAHADHWDIRLSLPAKVSADRLFITTGTTDTAAALAFARAITGRHSGSLHIIVDDDRSQLQAVLPLRVETLLG